MCNPREVVVTATRMIDEAWELAVRRTIEMSGRVTGEARVRERLDASLPNGVLRAFESLLANSPDWVSTEHGFRHEVEGGYVVYHIEDRSLEIVATECDEVRVAATAERSLGGQVSAQLQAEGVGRFYDDGFGGRTEAVGRQEAEAEAQRRLDQQRLERLEQAKRDAAEASAAELQDEAERRAAADLERAAAERQIGLENAARQHLASVGARARQLFYRQLGGAYRDTILAYARRNGAENVSCSDQGDIVEIEFMVRR